MEENESVTEDRTGEVPAEEALDAGRDGADVDIGDPDELRRRLGAKDQHIKELYEELAVVRIATDEARARAEADELRVQDLEEERERLRESLRELEEEERRQRRQREGQDRQVARLEREMERREANIRRLEDLVAKKKDEMAARSQESEALIARKDAALEAALRKVEGLEHDLEEREEEATELKATIDKMRAELDLEYELRRRMAEPENRLRAGIVLFNNSERLQEVGSISKSLGQPEVYVSLGDGDEPPTILTFTWQDVSWRTYAANPGFAVEEPRVYQTGAGEDPSGIDRKPPNAHIDPDGQVVLGL